MVAIIHKYRIRCTTDNVDELVLSTSGPTACPTNGAHSVDLSSVAIVEGDVLINDGTPKNLSLDEYKCLRFNEIDAKTNALISAGFAYDSKTFSASISAQMNWNALKDSESDFTWPVDISTIDSDSYSLAQADLSTFWLAGKDTIKGHLDSGRALKKSVFDAVDEAAVDAVVDNR